MKKKFSKILGVGLALALVLSLVVMATPVAAADITVGPGKTHATIQLAIDAASSGDIITVADGSYTEDLTVNIPNLTIRSETGKANTTIWLVDGVGIDIQGGASGFTLGGAEDEGFSILSGSTTTFNIQLPNAPSGVEISHNSINTVGNASQGVSVGAAGATDLIVTNNLFIADEGGVYQDVPISLNGPVTNLTATYNVITGSGIPGKYGAAIDIDKALSGGTITNNTISRFDRGIMTGSGGGVVEDLLISQNEISGCGWGILFRGTGVDMDSVTVSENNIHDNTLYGLENTTTTAVDATLNYWGHFTGPSLSPGLGDRVGGNVLHIPWLNAPYPDGLPTAPLFIEITTPASVYVCQDFEVQATITNLYDVDPTDVKAIIDAGENAEWVSGGDADLSHHPQYTDTIQPGEKWTVTWMLHCKAAGSTTVTVKAQYDHYSAWSVGTDSVTQNAPDLTIDITEPALGTEMVVNQTFPVTATVESFGGNTDVTATITYPGGVEWVTGGATATGHDIDLGAMSHGQSEQVTWTLRCIDAGLGATINVDAVSLEADAVNATVDVDQFAPEHPRLVATVTGPSKAYDSQTFSIHASIENTGEETAMDVTATISFVNPVTGLPSALADLVLPGETATKLLGDIPAGAIHLVEWTVHCNGADAFPKIAPSTIWVIPAGKDDITDEAIPATAGFWEVPQYPRQAIEVVIDSPDPLTKWGPACGPYPIEFTVTNTGYADLTDVTVTLAIVGNAEIEGGDPADLVIDIGELDQHESLVFDEGEGAFSIDCIGEDEGDPIVYTTFTVTVTGISEICEDEVTHEASVQVYQKYLHVTLGITVGLTSNPAEVCVGQDIKVDANIVNCVTGVLTNVTAELFIDDGDVYLEGAWPPIINPPNIASGFTYNTFAMTGGAGWHIHCNGTGPVTLRVEVNGISGVDTYRNTGTFTFNQVTGPVLEATIDSPETCRWYAVGDTFTVTGTIANIGDGLATNVVPTLFFVVTGEPVGTGDGSTDQYVLNPAAPGNIDPGSESIYLNGVLQTAADYVLNDDTGLIDFTVDVPADVLITADYRTVGPIVGAVITSGPTWTGLPLAALDDHAVTWTLECQGPTDFAVPELCDVGLVIDVTGEGVCDPDPSASSNTVTVHQLPLAVEVTIVTEGDVITGETFSVDAIIKNVGGGFDCPCEILDVTATIKISGPAMLAGNETETKTVGTVPWNIEQTGAEGMKAQWTVLCVRPGTVTITVTAQTSTNPATGLPLGYTLSISDSEEVEQLPALITYEVPLAKDWNYMSLPIIPKDTAIEEVLVDLVDASGNPLYTEAWAYEGQEWQLYVPDKPDSYYAALELDKLTEMKEGVGYIIRMIDPGILQRQGYELEPGAALPPAYNLLQGWNLSGFKTMDFNGDDMITQADDTMRVGYYLGNVDANYNNVIIGQEARFLRYYEPGDGWKELAQDDNMWVGKGNWLYASETGLIIVPPIVAE